MYPSKEEAEYTAVLAFAIAVSASWWAVRKGLATLQVPRMPAFIAVGRREHWLDMDPRAMRECCGLAGRGYRSDGSQLM